MKVSKEQINIKSLLLPLKRLVGNIQPNLMLYLKSFPPHGKSEIQDEARIFFSNIFIYNAEDIICLKSRVSKIALINIKSNYSLNSENISVCILDMQVLWIFLKVVQLSEEGTEKKFRWSNVLPKSGEM